MVAFPPFSSSLGKSYNQLFVLSSSSKQLEMGHCYFVIYVLGTRKCIIFYAYLCHIIFFFHFFSMQCKSIKIQTSSYTLGLQRLHCSMLYSTIKPGKMHTVFVLFSTCTTREAMVLHFSAFQCSTVSVMVLLLWVKLCDTADGREDYNHIQMYTFYWTLSCLSYISTLEVNVILEELSPLVSICSSIHIVHPFF